MLKLKWGNHYQVLTKWLHSTSHCKSSNHT